MLFSCINCTWNEHQRNQSSIIKRTKRKRRQSLALDPPLAGFNLCSAKTVATTTKNPPVPEVMATLRHRRALLKDLKAAHREERRVLMDPLLGDLERLAIKQAYGYQRKTSEWVENI